MKRTALTIHEKQRTSRTPTWASKYWNVYREQYHVGAIQWNDREKTYELLPMGRHAFFSEDLHEIEQHLLAETAKHRHELWVRNCDRTSKQVVRRKQ